MNNKDFFKSALKDEMPDLETVRKKCVTSEKNKSIIVTVLKSDLVLKRLLPMAACIVLTAVTVISFYSSDTPEKFITPPQYNGEEFKGSIPTEKTAKKKNDKEGNKNNNNVGGKNSNYDNKNNQENTQKSSQDMTQPDTTFETKNKVYFAIPGISKDYVSFSSVDELKTFVSSLYTENDYVIVGSENSFILEIPYNELSMFLQEKKFYTFSIDGAVIGQNGVIEKYIADNLTGCSFSANYGGIEYELGYSTYKCTKDTAINEEFVNRQGYSVKMTDKNLFFMNIDGYYFYVKALTDDAQIAKEFVNNLEINCENV